MNAEEMKTGIDTARTIAECVNQYRESGKLQINAIIAVMASYIDSNRERYGGRDLTREELTELIEEYKPEYAPITQENAALIRYHESMCAEMTAEQIRNTAEIDAEYMAALFKLNDYSRNLCCDILQRFMRSAADLYRIEQQFEKAPAKKQLPKTPIPPKTVFPNDYITNMTLQNMIDKGIQEAKQSGNNYISELIQQPKKRGKKEESAMVMLDLDELMKQPEMTIELNMSVYNQYNRAVQAVICSYCNPKEPETHTSVSLAAIYRKLTGSGRRGIKAQDLEPLYNSLRLMSKTRLAIDDGVHRYEGALVDIGFEMNSGDLTSCIVEIKGQPVNMRYAAELQQILNIPPEYLKVLQSDHKRAGSGTRTRELIEIRARREKETPSRTAIKSVIARRICNMNYAPEKKRGGFNNDLINIQNVLDTAGKGLTAEATTERAANYQRRADTEYIQTILDNYTASGIIKGYAPLYEGKTAEQLHGKTSRKKITHFQIIRNTVIETTATPSKPKNRKKQG